MPLRAHHITPRSTAPDRPTRVANDVPFDDLVYLLAEGVADAQSALDSHTAETLDTLSETAIDVIPSITRTIESDGSVTTETAPVESRSLLELGLTPARYQFSDATIEVAVDIHATDQTGPGDEVDDDSPDERADRPLALRADTRIGTEQRRFGQEIDVNARLAARLQPTPLPARIGAAAGGGQTTDHSDPNGGADGN